LENVSEKDKVRPVRIEVEPLESTAKNPGRMLSHEFGSASRAVEFLRGFGSYFHEELQEGEDGDLAADKEKTAATVLNEKEDIDLQLSVTAAPSTPPPPSLLLGLAVRILSAPALAGYLRILTYSDERKWSERNIFACYSYASKVTAVPTAIAKSQHIGVLSNFHESKLSWERFFESKDQNVLKFLSEAQKVEQERAKEVVLEDETHWELQSELSNDFWTVHINSGLGNRAVISLRGGDNANADRLDDLKFHPGSPLRAFCRNEDPETVPVPTPTLAQLLPFISSWFSIPNLSLHYDIGWIFSIMSFLLGEGTPI